MLYQSYGHKVRVGGLHQGFGFYFVAFNNLPGLGCDLRVSASRILVVWVYHGFRDAAFRIVLCLGVSLLCMGNVMVSRLCVLICMRGFRKS